MVAVLGLHNAGHLAVVQLQSGLLIGGDHLAQSGSVAVGALLQALVLAVLVHQVVEEGGGVVAGVELGQNVLSQGLLLVDGLLVQLGIGVGAVLLDGGGTLGVHGLEEDVAGLIDVVVQVVLGGLADGGVEDVVIEVVDGVDELHGLVAEAVDGLALVVLLLALGHEGLVELGLLLVGEGAAQLLALGLQNLVVGGDGLAVLLELVGVVGHIGLVHLGEIGAVHRQEVQVQVGGNHLAVGGEHGLVALEPGGEVQDVSGQVGHDLLRGSGGVGGLGGGGGTGGQGEGHPGGQKQRRDALFHSHHVVTPFSGAGKCPAQSRGHCITKWEKRQTLCGAGR